jgi:DNA-damage-inducible protein J
MKKEEFMVTTNLNVRTEKVVKEKAEAIFNELGLNMTTAINIFLRTTIRENGIPFDLKLSEPNEVTKAAIEEGRKIARDKTIAGYTSVDELMEVLDK